MKNSLRKSCYFKIGLPPNIQTVIAAHKRTRLGLLDLHIAFEDVLPICLKESKVKKNLFGTFRMCWGFSFSFALVKSKNIKYQRIHM